VLRTAPSDHVPWLTDLRHRGHSGTKELEAFATNGLEIDRIEIVPPPHDSTERRS
jgi:hypothetical protein